MNLLLALIFYFEQFLGLNLEILYIVSIILIAKDLFKNHGILTIKTIYYKYFIILYSLIQIPILGYMDIIENVAFLGKFFICMFIFVYTKENINKFDSKGVVWNLSILYSISVPISLIFKNSNLLWRHNDLINKYSTTRLQLFYFEPSELAFYVSITIILFICLWNQYRKPYFIKITILILLLTTLILTGGIGGIATLSVTLIIMYNLYVFSRNTKLKSVMYIGVTLVAIIGFTLFITSENPLALRINEIINGSDQSVNYRFDVGRDVLVAAIENTKGLGVGFGNLNTPQVISIYSKYGLVQYIANSFMYFIAEGGFFSLLYLIIFIANLIINITLQKDILKFGLLIFIIIYQVAGGYITSPLIWLIYGIIASKNFKSDFSKENYI